MKGEYCFQKHCSRVNYARDRVKNSRHLTITNFIRSPATTYANIKVDWHRQVREQL